MFQLRYALLALTGALALGAGTAAAQGPPPPTAANGQPVATVATGVPTPVAFAFDGTTTFVAAGGDEATGKGGGIYAIPEGGPATLVPNTPPVVYGITAHDGTIYASSGPHILAFSGWNGTTFSTRRTVYDGVKTTGPIGGLAWGPNGRIYGGATLDPRYDVNKKGKARRNPLPAAFSIFSVAPSGGTARVVARGLRQPWQITFVQGRPNPFVSDLSQDAGKIPLDKIVVARPGARFGFPKHPLGTAPRRVGLSKPLVTLPRHSSPMGMSASGSTLYVALFGGLRGKPEVVTVPAAGGRPTPFLTGFVAPVLASGINAGNLYVGDLTGSIYRVAVAA
jgi:hypothetical protein